MRLTGYSSRDIVVAGDETTNLVALKMPAELPAFHLLKLLAAGTAHECIHLIIDGLD
jgi:hypothetical protein